ncbi:MULTISPECIES: hypothetical protein [unclassified Janthinobacterium]|uniref:hypothetical protein n=1 Tax=unclassified Janthinobacterium TaxID=2610881 RepID=UPI0016224FC3|nr:MULTISPECIES: hypothetical protein [unclassified Janthinobacterium]MBB5371380.1 hypothetical protein [Janthinobacterium sp. K2C7]MBB5384186.1 hypothetical protein [Janthinobacterium sp. K2Li3]MBB5389354.1 hypothetical protein [Janthinobacterium sp. K2E3]
MTTLAFKQTWTALKGKLIFDFTLYRSEEHGASIVKICFEGDGEHRVHEVLLPSGPTRHLDFQFNFTPDGVVYVKGTLRHESNHHGDADAHVTVFADIVYGHQGRHDERHFEGFMIAINCHEASSASEPIAPPLPVNAPDSARCLAVGAEALRLRFISYVPAIVDPSAPPGNTLYQALLAARPAGRESMEALALRYIQGESPCAPAFLGLPGELPALWHSYVDVAMAAQQLCSQPKLLQQRIFTLLHAETDEQVAALLASPACADATAAAWQSYFALIITPGHDNALLSTLPHFLGAIHLLNHLYLFAPSSPPSAATLTALAHASIVLPAAIFPLPAAKDAASGD